MTSSALALATTFESPESWTNEYDYFLVRGFAVVEAAGLGTYGSEGIECCSTEMERDAFVAIVEWLAGKADRHAYTNATDNVEVKAEWSSGNVGMIGVSYPDEMAYATATSAVDGLKTIVPVAGPISMYDEHNSQGICTEDYNSYNHLTMQADACASRFFPEHSPSKEHLSLYERYRTFVRDGQTQLQGDYGPFWEDRDWYAKGMRARMSASALIVMGFNDSSVSTKQFDLMRKSFLASGCEVKTILHQSVHESLNRESECTDIAIGGRPFIEWLNLWFTRALCGVENEAATLPDFMVQSNVDGEFYRTEKWDEETAVTMRRNVSGETAVSAKGARMNAGELLQDTFVGVAHKNAALWTLPVTEWFTIAGKVPIRVRAKVDDVREGDMMMHAILVDTADEPFYAHTIDNVRREPVGKRADYPRDYTMAKFVGGKVAKKVVATGAIDFRNPEAGYEPYTAVKREDPIEESTYYDYTIWLRPTYYTVQAGHRLELYLVPFYGYSEYPDAEGRDYILEKNGLDASCLMNIRNDYTFTIDNGKSSASIPVTEVLRHRPVTYFAHVQGRGDLRVVADGITSGTAGEARRLEAISACVEGGSISYRSHVQGIGWTPWVVDGAICGTTGQMPVPLASPGVPRRWRRSCCPKDSSPPALMRASLPVFKMTQGGRVPRRSALKETPSPTFKRKRIPMRQ